MKAEHVHDSDTSQERVNKTEKSEHEDCMDDIHSCSYFCDRPACVKAQRDKLREILYERTWVGLTKEEVNSWERSYGVWMAQFAQFIEAKLKDKNT